MTNSECMMGPLGVGSHGCCVAPTIRLDLTSDRTGSSLTDGRPFGGLEAFHEALRAGGRGGQHCRGSRQDSDGPETSAQSQRDLSTTSSFAVGLAAASTCGPEMLQSA